MITIVEFIHTVVLPAVPSEFTVEISHEETMLEVSIRHRLRCCAMVFTLFKINHPTVRDVIAAQDLSLNRYVLRRNKGVNQLVVTASFLNSVSRRGNLINPMYKHLGYAQNIYYSRHVYLPDRVVTLAEIPLSSRDLVSKSIFDEEAFRNKVLLRPEHRRVYRAAGDEVAIDTYDAYQNEMLVDKRRRAIISREMEPTQRDIYWLAETLPPSRELDLFLAVRLWRSGRNISTYRSSAEDFLHTYLVRNRKVVTQLKKRKREDDDRSTDVKRVRLILRTSEDRLVSAVRTELEEETVCESLRDLTLIHQNNDNRVIYETLLRFGETSL